MHYFVFHIKTEKCTIRELYILFQVIVRLVFKVIEKNIAANVRYIHESLNKGILVIYIL